MITRETYILRLAAVLAGGADDPSATEQEWQEADLLLTKIGVINASTLIDMIGDSAATEIETEFQPEEALVMSAGAGAGDIKEEDYPQWP